MITKPSSTNDTKPVNKISNPAAVQVKSVVYSNMANNDVSYISDSNVIVTQVKPTKFNNSTNKNFNTVDEKDITFRDANDLELYENGVEEIATSKSVDITSVKGKVCC